MRTSSGFTLIELMVVIVVMAAALAFGVPAAIHHTNHAGPRYAADTLNSDLQLARMRAIKNNQRCRVIFNAPLPNRYTIQDLTTAGALIGNFKFGDLNIYRGNIVFRAQGPLAADTAPLTSFEISPQGIVEKKVPAASSCVYLTNQVLTMKESKNVRVRISLAGSTDIDEIFLGQKDWR